MSPDLAATAGAFSALAPTYDATFGKNPVGLFFRYAVQERLRFEKLLSEISGAFVHVPSHEMPEVFETWLERLARFLND